MRTQSDRQQSLVSKVPNYSSTHPSFDHISVKFHQQQHWRQYEQASFVMFAVYWAISNSKNTKREATTTKRNSKKVTHWTIRDTQCWDFKRSGEKNIYYEINKNNKANISLPMLTMQQDVLSCETKVMSWHDEDASQTNTWGLLEDTSDSPLCY